MSIQDAAGYLRQRLLRLHDMNGLLYKRKAWEKMRKCILEKTTPEEVDELGAKVLPWSFTEEAARAAEFALVEWYGSERYADAELLKRNVIDTLVRYRISIMMDAIYTSCGADVINRPEELMESAAWYAGK
jgi:hypothetical protein